MVSRSLSKKCSGSLCPIYIQLTLRKLITPSGMSRPIPSNGSDPEDNSVVPNNWKFQRLDRYPQDLAHDKRTNQTG